MRAVLLACVLATVAAAGAAICTAAPDAGAGTPPTVTVAVLDTGIDASHPAFAGRLLPGRDFVFPGDDDPEDEHGGSHGTHAAGLALGAGRGPRGPIEAELARGVRLLPLRAADAVGSVAAADLARAVRHAVEAGARVLSASLILDERDARVALAAFRLAEERDVLVVAAAGNQGLDIDDAAIYPAAWEMPNVIVVAGFNALTGDLWAGSNHGARRAHLAAPALRVVGPSAGGGTSALTGTSSAVPQVAYAAALVRLAHPEWSAARVKAHLLATARRVEALAARVSSSGILDVARAVGDDVGPEPEPAATLDSPEAEDSLARVERARAELSLLPPDDQTRRIGTDAVALRRLLATNLAESATFRDEMARETGGDLALDVREAEFPPLAAAIALDPDVIWSRDRALIGRVMRLARLAVERERERERDATGAGSSRRGLVDALDGD